MDVIDEAIKDMENAEESAELLVWAEMSIDPDNMKTLASQTAYAQQNKLDNQNDKEDDGGQRSDEGDIRAAPSKWQCMQEKKTS